MGRPKRLQALPKKQRWWPPKKEKLPQTMKLIQISNHPSTICCHFNYTSFVNISQKSLLTQRSIMRSTRREKRRTEKNRKNWRRKRESMRKGKKRRKGTRRPGKGLPESLKEMVVLPQPSLPKIALERIFVGNISTWVSLPNKIVYIL